MNQWFFWIEYQKALDNLPKKEIQRIVRSHRPDTQDSSSLLDRETPKSSANDRVSRFLYCIQQMPRAWGSRPWSSHKIIKAGNNIANDLFRRKVRREYLGKG